MDEKDRVITEIYNESKEKAKWVVFLRFDATYGREMYICDARILSLIVSPVLFPRANGFKKQTEILRQKHAEFLEKYKMRNDGEDK